MYVEKESTGVDEQRRGHNLLGRESSLGQQVTSREEAALNPKNLSSAKNLKTYREAGVTCRFHTRGEGDDQGALNEHSGNRSGNNVSERALRWALPADERTDRVEEVFFKGDDDFDDGFSDDNGISITTASGGVGGGQAIRNEASPASDNTTVDESPPPLASSSVAVRSMMTSPSPRDPPPTAEASVPMTTRLWAAEHASQKFKPLCSITSAGHQGEDRDSASLTSTPSSPSGVTVRPPTPSLPISLSASPTSASRPSHVTTASKPSSRKSIDGDFSSVCVRARQDSEGGGGGDASDGGQAQQPVSARR